MKDLKLSELLSKHTKNGKIYAEILLDVSGSMKKEDFERSLLQIKHLIKKTDIIKLGQFSGDFYGWQKLKSEKDLLYVKRMGMFGTNFENAFSAFSNEENVNRIMITDGLQELTNFVKNNLDDYKDILSKVNILVTLNKDFDVEKLNSNISSIGKFTNIFIVDLNKENIFEEQPAIEEEDENGSSF